MAEAPGFQIFVGSLPSDITEEELQFVFKSYGKVKNIRILKPEDRKGGKGGVQLNSDAIAWVTYFEKEPCEDAIDVLNDQYRIRDDKDCKPMKVEWANQRKGSGKGGKDKDGAGKAPPEDWNAAHYSGWRDTRGRGWEGNGSRSRGGQLFVGNLPADTEQEVIGAVFAKYGLVDKVHLIHGRSKNYRSCAYVEYRNLEDADVALQTLHQRYCLRRGDQPIYVDWANDGRRVSPY